MPDPMDIIPVPNQPGHYGRRAFVDAWVRAGNPPLNSSLRLYSEQKTAREKYLNGTGAPADDPDRPDLFVLAHVRGVAGDADATPARVRALEAQGLVRPYDYEPWHWQLPGNVRIYPLVTAIPDFASTTAKPFDPKPILEEAMANPIVNVKQNYSDPHTSGTIWIGRDDGTFQRLTGPFDPNVRGVISVAFFGGKGSEDLAPTLNARDFQTLQRLWKTMKGGV